MTEELKSNSWKLSVNSIREQNTNEDSECLGLRRLPGFAEDSEATQINFTFFDVLALSCSHGYLLSHSRRQSKREFVPVVENVILFLFSLPFYLIQRKGFSCLTCLFSFGHQFSPLGVSVICKKKNDTVTLCFVMYFSIF